ncbi:hypothetical protein Goshw_006009, partial [Gossypium schwendimanii]|nr:hypothetical protein [Gossypium schwendimanii]
MGRHTTRRCSSTRRYSYFGTSSNLVSSLF